MTISATKFNFSATLILAALAIAPQFSTPAQASVTSDLLNCRYNSRQKAVNCCEQILRNNKRPLWMQSSSRSCSSVVICVGGKNDPKAIAYAAEPNCSIKIPLNDNQRSPNPRDTNLKRDSSFN